jgi:hypothetical protein
MPLLLRIFSLFTLLIFAFQSNSQSLNQKWKPDLEASLQEFLQCATAGTKEKCGSYVGESVHTVYNIKDFYSPETKRYMNVNEITSFLKGNDKWQNLGQPYDQKTLITAQEYANAKKAVVAVYTNAQGIGHVAVITPGELKPSGSWGMEVPNAASFFPNDPGKSFIDKGLSFAFMKQMLKDVVIYGRKY